MVEIKGKTHILMLAPFFPPFRGAVSSRLESFAKYWSKLARVTVISAYPGEAKEKGYSLIRFPLARWRFEPLKIVFTHTKLHSLVKELNPDVIFVSIPPVWPLLEGILLAHRLGKKIILDVRDLPEADSRISNISILRKMQHKITSLIAKHYGKKVSSLVAVTDYFKSRLENFLDYPEKEIFVIRNASETQIFKKSQAIRKEFDIVYSGTLIQARNPSGILNFLSQLRELYPHLHTLFISDLKNPLGKEFRKSLIELGLEDHVVTIEPCPPSELPIWLGKTRLGLTALISGLKHYRGAVGAKNYEYLAAGLPIVGLLDPEYYVEEGRLIRENNVGIVSSDTQKLASKTADLLRDSGQLNEMSRRAQNKGKLFDRKKMAERYMREVILPLVRKNIH